MTETECAAAAYCHDHDGSCLQTCDALNASECGAAAHCHVHAGVCQEDCTNMLLTECAASSAGCVSYLRRASVDLRLPLLVEPGSDNTFRATSCTAAFFMELVNRALGTTGSTAGCGGPPIVTFTTLLASRLAEIWRRPSARPHRIASRRTEAAWRNATA